jgi:hypothetical protein
LLNPLDSYYLKQEEPVKSCLQFLRAHILGSDPQITEAWKYGMPFFCYHGKMICYLWVHKQLLQPYLGVVDGKLIDHPDLMIEKRARMKILRIDPDKNMPLKKLNVILKQMIALRQ